MLICCYGSETGEFCAIKEVEFVRDDPKSKESAKQLAQVSKISPACLYIVFSHKIVSRIFTTLGSNLQEIVLLSSLRHPNIVHYKGSETVSKLCTPLNHSLILHMLFS